MSTAIITMAGFGSRFLKAGYDIPKYRIEAHGRTLFAWSMLSLRSFIAAGYRFVFIVRAADDAAEFIVREAALLGISAHEVVQLDGPTDGQATTALLAGCAIIQPDCPALIYNIDTFVHPDALSADGVRGDGWIPCFQAAGDHWSFAAADAEGRVTQVREKVRISPHATVGLYWFSSFDLYAEAYRDYYGSGANVEAGERYVAPLYNHLLAEDRAVFVHDVDTQAVIPLGTPAEVAAFRSRQMPWIDPAPSARN